MASAAPDLSLGRLVRLQGSHKRALVPCLFDKDIMAFCPWNLHVEHAHVPATPEWCSSHVLPAVRGRWTLERLAKKKLCWRSTRPYFWSLKGIWLRSEAYALKGAVGQASYCRVTIPTSSCGWPVHPAEL